jgi:chitinase
MVFTVALTAATDVPVSVNYSTATGDLEWDPSEPYSANILPASADDFRAKSGTVTFAPGERSKQITVEVNGDRAAEPDEAFSVNLSGAAGGVISTGHAVAVIQNDEPRVWVDGWSHTEGNTGTTSFPFVVTLNMPYDVPVTVSYATADGTATVVGYDYVANSGSFTFAPGETSKTVNVSVRGDRTAEEEETFSLNLTAADGATVSTDPAMGYILNDEPVAGATGGAVTEGNSGTKSIAFVVSLSAVYDIPVTVSYATTDGTATVAGGDYVAKSGTVTFAVGQTSKTVNVSVRGDRVAEENEAFYFNLTAATGATFADIPVQGDILDNEPRVSISNSSLREGNSGTRSMTFTVTLEAAYDQPVTVRYRTADGTARASLGDYVAKSGTVTFNPGQTRRTFTVTVKGDTKSERNEYFHVVLGATSTNTRFLGNVARGNILDDDR